MWQAPSPARISSTGASDTVDAWPPVLEALRVDDLRRTLVTTVEAVLDLVVPRRCAGCGAPQELLCQACSASLAGPAFPTRPDPCPAGLPTTWAVSAYDGPTRAALLAHKEHNRLGLARPLGVALARSVAAAVVDQTLPVVLVPVPSSPAATRRRGHDPMLRCARQAAYRLRLGGRPAMVAPILALARTVADQSGLDAAARAANLAGAHRVRWRGRRHLEGGCLVIVDDLITTGASLSEAARALGVSGLQPAAAAVVAATRRRPRLDRQDTTA